MSNQKPIDGDVLATVWSFLAGILFVYFLAIGLGLAGFLVAVSGVVALPSLRDVWLRYGADTKTRRYICIGSFALSVMAVIAFPPVDHPEEAVAVTDETLEDETIADSETQSADDTIDAAAAAESVTLYDQPETSNEPELSTVTGCEAIDGDTLKCGIETVRLLGIDAPELVGHCAVGRDCVAGDPIASQQNLKRATKYVMQIVRVGQDRYFRTLAMVFVDGESLSCRQLRSGQADYIPEWDDGKRVVSSCTLKDG